MKRASAGRAAIVTGGQCLSAGTNAVIATDETIHFWTPRPFSAKNNFDAATACA